MDTRYIVQRMNQPSHKSDPPFRPHSERIYRILFESETRTGRLFDIALIFAILTNVVVVLLQSIPDLNRKFFYLFNVLEWLLTVAFTAEYVTRLWVLRKPIRFARSFYGMVDLIAVLPTYVSYFFPATQYFAIIRALRLLRLFQIFRLSRFLREAVALRQILVASRARIVVFVIFVMIIVVIMGATMYVVEGPSNGFTSIPESMYWAIVTMATVGYGDIAPQTPIGKTLASVVILLGYSLIGVPTGIVSAEVAKNTFQLKACPRCGATGHAKDAAFCRKCGTEITTKVE